MVENAKASGNTEKQEKTRVLFLAFGVSVAERGSSFRDLPRKGEILVSVPCFFTGRGRGEKESKDRRTQGHGETLLQTASSTFIWGYYFFFNLNSLL